MIALVACGALILALVSFGTGSLYGSRQAHKLIESKISESWTVVGYTYTDIWGNITSTTKVEHMRTDTTIITVSSTGTVDEHRYRHKLTEKQIEMIATQNNWVCDIENLEKTGL